MRKSLCFEEINPFIRHARFLEVGGNTKFSASIPYDCRLFYTYRGQGKIIIGAETYVLPKGSLLFIPAAIEYQLVNQHQVLYLAINFDYTYDHYKKLQPIPPDPPCAFVSENILEQITFTDQQNLNTAIYMNNMNKIEAALLEIEYEYSHKKLYYNNKTSALFQDVLINMVRALSFNSDNNKARKIDDIIDYIQKHYCENITNSDIAKLFNYHPNYINQMMVARTGTSLYQYIISLRISKAIKLLETGNLSICEIAYMVGFNDLSHFSRYFKKITGKRPSDFMKN